MGWRRISTMNLKRQPVSESNAAGERVNTPYIAIARRLILYAGIKVLC
jgi:hypothetical protein